MFDLETQFLLHGIVESRLSLCVCVCSFFFFFFLILLILKGSSILLYRPFFNVCNFSSWLCPMSFDYPSFCITCLHEPYGGLVKKFKSLSRPNFQT